MRRQTGLSVHQTAALLQTEAYVIDALETGAVAELPAWPDTARIVQGYAAMVGVDPAQILEAIYRRVSPRDSAKRSNVDRAAVAAGKSKRIKTALASRDAMRPVFKLW